MTPVETCERNWTTWVGSKAFLSFHSAVYFNNSVKTNVVVVGRKTAIRLITGNMNIVGLLNGTLRRLTAWLWPIVCLYRTINQWTLRLHTKPTPYFLHHPHPEIRPQSAGCSSSSVLQFLCLPLTGITGIQYMSLNSGINSWTLNKTG